MHPPASGACYNAPKRTGAQEWNAQLCLIATFLLFAQNAFLWQGSGLWCIGDTFSQLSLVMAQKHLLLLISHNCSLFPVQISFHSITQCCVRCYKKSEFSDLNQKNHLMIILSSFPHPFCWQHWDIYHNADDVEYFSRRLWQQTHLIKDTDPFLPTFPSTSSKIPAKKT